MSTPRKKSLLFGNFLEQVLLFYVTEKNVLEEQYFLFIIGGLLTIRNLWESKLVERKPNVDDSSFLDIGCCVDDKSWICKRYSNGIYQYKWSSGNSLLAFFTAFLNELQIRGTIPAMELTRYYNGFPD